VPLARRDSRGRESSGSTADEPESEPALIPRCDDLLDVVLAAKLAPEARDTANVLDGAGEPVVSAAEARAARDVTLRFGDGDAAAEGAP